MNDREMYEELHTVARKLMGDDVPREIITKAVGFHLAKLGQHMKAIHTATKDGSLFMQLIACDDYWRRMMMEHEVEKKVPTL
jgi:hypothetical protein